jgi:hypothetical protein
MMFLKTQDAAGFVESMIACFAAPVIAGLKCGALINLSRRGDDMISAWRAARQRIEARYGVEFAEISCSRQSVLLFIYKSVPLRAFISSAETRAFLEGLGYEFDAEGEGLLSCVSRLASRFNEGVPHEVGIFLGYPLEDVKGFIKNGGRNSKLSGYWKVYGDEAVALKKFEEYRRAETDSAEMVLKTSGGII